MRSTSQFPRYITKLIPLFQLIITMYHMRSDFRRWNNLPILSTGLPFVVLKLIDRCTIRLHSPVSFFILSVRSSVLMRSLVGFQVWGLLSLEDLDEGRKRLIQATTSTGCRERRDGGVLFNWVAGDSWWGGLGQRNRPLCDSRRIRRTVETIEGGRRWKRRYQ